MKRQYSFTIFRLFLALIFMHQNAASDGTRIERVSKMTWDGVSTFIAVDRQQIQQKLDDYNGIKFGGCSRPQLYLPDTPVFPGHLAEDEHVVYFGFGKAASLDFIASPADPCYSSEVDFGNVMIPFLTDGTSGVPRYSLFVGRYYNRDRGDVYKPNLLAPYFPIDEVAIYDNDVLVMRNGTDGLRASFKRYNSPCKTVPRVVRHEFEGVHDDTLEFGLPEPQFEVCDLHRYENDFCSIVKDISCDVSRASPNICQLSWGEYGTPCGATMKIMNITSGFRDLLLLSNGPLRTISSESRNGTFYIGLKYPCVE